MDHILSAAFKALIGLFRVLKEGAFIILKTWPKQRQVAFLAWGVVFFSLGYNFWHFRLCLRFFPHIGRADRVMEMAEMGRVMNGFVLTAVFFAVVFFISGFLPYSRLSRMRKALDRLNIKAGSDCRPKLLNIKRLTDHKTKLTLHSLGVGIEHYQKRLGDIEAIFNATVESIRKGREPQFVEIILTTRAMPAVCHYQEVVEAITKDYSFVVGEGLNGVITKSILDFPGGHLLIAGTTGGGKSNWFKACLLSLLKTSPHGEFFLLDFKGGVEFAPLRKFPNVSVEKNMQEALRRLRMIVQEMNRRFDYLEKVERASISPKKDKVNHLFVAVDEASLLYGQLPRTDRNYEFVMEARKLTDDIAKRGRAACISLILATQKVTKETIGTSIQENITGRICFRMNTLQGSMIVLGNKLALELPDIPGRGVWQCGNEQIEIQAPWLQEKDLKAAIESYGEGRFFDLLEQRQQPEKQQSSDFVQNLKN